MNYFLNLTSEERDQIRRDIVSRSQEQLDRDFLRYIDLRSTVLTSVPEPELRTVTGSRIQSVYQPRFYELSPRAARILDSQGRPLPLEFRSEIQAVPPPIDFITYDEIQDFTKDDMRFLLDKNIDYLRGKPKETTTHIGKYRIIDRGTK